ncbi:coniferyl alcohol acyltransferase-like [Cryptomeria japonica]|uniref:coniferyl alcohol acyltransferase-like n=1 Tax=Cryptomeria japonica TaxID=3369 RepID=UPI0027DA9497|nr:coniferyl alcohol acyltransferase-like [Cryptomeria japonica]
MIESITPSFTGSIIVPRDPPNRCSEINKMYMKLQSLPQPIKQIAEPANASRIYYLDAKDIEKLQHSAKKHGNNYSKLEAFSAYFWKLLIQCQEIKATINCNIRIAIDGRSRLKKMGMIANYFGNVLSTPFDANLIYDAIYRDANEEYFQSLVDLVEMSKPSIVVPRDFVKGDEPIFVVFSGLRFPLYEIDHGWGKPILASDYLPFSQGYVMPTPSPHRDGSWLIYVKFLVEQLKAIESHSNFILRKISTRMILIVVCLLSLRDLVSLML